MDHIPASADSPHSEKWPLLVPSGIEVSLSPDEWLELPYEHGFDGEAFMHLAFNPRFHGRSAMEIVKFLQLWLYFGTLSAGLGFPIKVSDFCVEDEDGIFLSTRNVQKLMLEFLERGWQRSEEERNQMRINLDELLLTVRRLLSGISLQKPDETELWNQVEYSIATLNTALQYVCPQMKDRDSLGANIHEGSVRLWGDVLSIPYTLQRHYAERGWCPSDLPRLNKLVSINALSYAITLRRDTSVDHSKCNENGCAVNKIDENTYRTQHRRSNCGCALIEDVCGQACKVLADNSYPLICLDRFSEASPVIEVVPFRSGLQYTAISHVWSDGLGNAKANAVTTCQLLHIASLLGTFADSRLIWLDTLCVPLDHHYRKQAIIRMTEVYEQATQVLVFDSELRRVKYQNKPSYESFARIAVSGWMRRVWTLQEGVLANRLFVEFQDGVMDVSAAVNTSHDKTNAKTFELDMVQTEFMLVVGVLTGLRQIRDKESEYFLNTWNAVRLRRTTRKGDDILCFASMQHLDLKPIVEAQEYEEKMKACMSLMTFLPAGLLWTAGRKLDIDGYRWAPYSFLQEEPVVGDWNTIKRDEKGLRTLNFTIFLEDFDASALLQRAYLKDENDLVLKAEIHRSWNKSSVVPRLAGKSLAILTDHPTSRAVSYGDDVMLRGLLISILDWEGEWGPHCRYECLVDWGAVPRGSVGLEPQGRCVRSKSYIKWHLA